MSANLAAIEATIATLTLAGKLGQVDEARVSAARGLAAAVDNDPGNVSLWREYRAAEAALREVTNDSTQDELAALIKALSPAVGDTTDKPRVVRSPRRQSSGNVRPTADAVAATGRKRRPRASA